MKQSIYQKLLLSLTLVAFFCTFASAQVMDRNQVAPEMIEMKKKAKAQGLSEIPASWIKEAQQARAKRELGKQATLVKPTQQLERKPLSKLNVQKTVKKAVPLRGKAIFKEATLDRNVLLKEKKIATKKSPFQVATEINEKALREGSGMRASVIEVGGKHYVQLQPEESIKFKIKNQ